MSVKKRIYRYMVALTLACLLAFAALCTLLMYGLLRDMVIGDVKEKAELLTAIAGAEPEGLSRVFALNTAAADIRVTVISLEGEVLFDSFAASEGLENHADREEFQEAERLGLGESTRFSRTQGTLTYYYALRLPNQSVLRLSKDIASIRDVLLRTLPVLSLLLLSVFVLGNVLANRLTRSVLRPIHEMDPERDLAVYDELSPFVRTIAHQKENLALQQQDLNRRVALIHSIADNMREGLVLLDHRGNIVMANHSAQNLFSAPKDMVGCHVVELVRNVDILENAKAALAGEARECRLTFSEQVFHVFFSPSPDSGAMLILVDVTEKAKAEKVRAEFSANVSHELKTPLTSIYGYAQMLHQGMVAPEDTRRFAGVIETESRRLIQLVEDIMKLSQLDEKDRKPRMEPVDLLKVAKEVAFALKAKGQAQGITVDVSGQAPVISANQAMMYEMLFNLVDNAIKYNLPGGSVRVEIFAKDDQARIEVSDTGMGIAPEDQPRIFERFYRADKSRSKKVDGTGLGLAIVKHVVLIHGGTVDVSSREGKGTRIAVTLPIG